MTSDLLVADLLDLTPRPVLDAYDEWGLRGKPQLVAHTSPPGNDFESSGGLASILGSSPFMKQPESRERRWRVW
jgi:hypothetical protein